MSIEKSVEAELATRIENPCWDYVQTVPADSSSYIGIMGNGRFSPDQFAGLRDAISGSSKNYVDHRTWVTSQWAWAIPDPQVITFIVEWLAGRSVVELGAGSGYWAWLLAQSGVDVRAYDRAPIGHEDSWFKGTRGSRSAQSTAPPKEWHPVFEGDESVLALPENADRVLFLCWPNYNSTFAYDALKAYQGDYVIYVGEGDGGCNGDDLFWMLVEGATPWLDDVVPHIEQEWDRDASCQMIQWSGIHDNLTIYKRRA